MKKRNAPEAYASDHILLTWEEKVSPYLIFPRIWLCDTLTISPIAIAKTLERYFNDKVRKINFAAPF